MTFAHFEITAHFEEPANVDSPRDWVKQSFIETFGRFCRDGIFQFERGEETGRLHIQGHGILEQVVASKHAIVNKLRNTFWKDASVNPSCSNVVADFQHKRITLEQMYAAKEETREWGPFRFGTGHQRRDVYIPRQQREISDDQLRNWQKKVMELAVEWNTRHVHVIMNEGGNEGKSWLAQRMRLLSGLKCFQVANVKDRERLEADMASKLIKAKCTEPNVVFIDLPKAIPKDDLHGLFAGAEQIKSGYLNDTRNESKEIDFDCPNVFIFTNRWPRFSHLTEDRWRLWVLKDHEMTEVRVEDVIYEQQQAELKKIGTPESKLGKKRKRD